MTSPISPCGLRWKHPTDVTSKTNKVLSPPFPHICLSTPVSNSPSSPHKTQNRYARGVIYLESFWPTHPWYTPTTQGQVMRMFWRQGQRLGAPGGSSEVTATWWWQVIALYIRGWGLSLFRSLSTQKSTEWQGHFLLLGFLALLNPPRPTAPAPRQSAMGSWDAPGCTLLRLRNLQTNNLKKFSYFHVLCHYSGAWWTY